MSQSDRLIELNGHIDQLEKEIQEEIRRPECNAVLLADLRIERDRFDRLAQNERERVDRINRRRIRFEHQHVHFEQPQARLALQQQARLSRQQQSSRVQARAVPAGEGTCTVLRASLCRVSIAHG